MPEEIKTAVTPESNGGTQQTNVPDNLMGLLNDIGLGSSPAASQETAKSTTETNTLPAQNAAAASQSQDGQAAQTLAQNASETTTATPTPPDADKEKINAIERAIASNPQLRAQYLSELYGVSIQAPLPSGQQAGQQLPAGQANQQQQVVNPQAAQQNAFPGFQQQVEVPSDEEFDPYSKSHMLSLIQSALVPYGHYIQSSIQQEEQARQQAAQAQQQAYIQQTEQNIQTLMEKNLPGWKDVYNSPEPTLEQNVLADFSEKAFAQALHDYPREVWTHPKVQADVALKIAPQIKNLATKLGVAFAQPVQADTAKQKAAAREMYVESSNALPATNLTDFDRAAKKGDTLGMIKALGIV